MSAVDDRNELIFDGSAAAYRRPGSFAESFIALQKSLKPLKRNATGDDGKPFAAIEDVWAYIRPKLAKHGFCVMQSEGADVVETSLLHTSGAFYRFTAKVIIGADGSVRYGRRHALMCLLGLVEEPIAKSEAVDYATIAATADGFVTRLGRDDATRVLAAFQYYKLGNAQMVVLAKSNRSADELIAEAQRLGGGK